MGKSIQRHQREYKDRLFKKIFSDRRDLLELYNALNGTSYDNPDDIVVNTLEDVIYLGMKNDISFILKNILSLYEHQSTLSPNLALRGMLYIASVIRQEIVNTEDLYSSRPIALPLPKFVVFYNGTREEPERREMFLHDLYPPQFRAWEADLDCRAVVLNINAGHNMEIMKKCSTRSLWRGSADTRTRETTSGRRWTVRWMTVYRKVYWRNCCAASARRCVRCY